MSTYNAGDRVTNGFANGTVRQLPATINQNDNDTHVWVEWDMEEWDEAPDVDSVHVDDLTAI